MPTALRPETIATVKATVPALTAHGAAIAEAMYRRLFEDAKVRALFNQSHQHGADGDPGPQAKAVAAAIIAYAGHIDDLAALAPAVEHISQKHVSLDILPEYYPSVGAALIGAIREVLGAAATDAVIAAWTEAYWFLADILIAREAGIYKSLASTKGGWTGWRRFRVARKAAECTIITSFVLEPEDGGPVVRQKPGQYLAFRLPIPGGEPVRRNYSISSAANGSSYRISVKREPGGLASNWLHDHLSAGGTVEISPPCGDFTLPERPERPVVLLSGGVGLTPMVSMLETIASDDPKLEAHYVHGTLNSATHAMDAHIRRLASSRQGLSVTVFYSAPQAQDEVEQNYDVPGLITIDWLRQNTPIAQADYYLCGPRPFMRNLVPSLARAGVPDARIHYEFFGPADEVLLST
jgi:nitric oxide dioxygenase